MRISQVYFLMMTSAMIAAASPPGNGQSIETTVVSLEVTNEPLRKVFQKIESQTDFLFAWNKKVNDYGRVTLTKGNYTIKNVLDIVLKGTGLKYEQDEKYILVTPEGKKESVVKEVEVENGVNGVELYSPALVTGTVRDAATQEPLAGVNIIVKGTNKGTTTDVEGKFEIEAEEDDVLVFSFIGFETFEIVVSGRSIIDVAMEEDVATLQEVTVNAGYYTTKKRESPGNIVKISSEEISNQPINNPLETLHGRMAGVYVSQITGVPGGNFNIKIRGANSLRSDANDPLYIIDGVPFSFQTLSSTDNTSGIFGTGASPLNGINPSDIESIEVLKDADATAIYGSRGANGVVLITTKKGKIGKTKVDVSLYRGFSKVTRQMDLMTTEQYLGMRMEAYANDGIASYPTNAYDINGTWDQNRYTDWQKVLIGGTANTTNAQFSMSGGTEETQFSFSGGYYNQTSVFPGDFNYRKTSSHFSVNHTSPNKKLNIRASVSYVVDKNNQPILDFTSYIFLPPNAPKLYSDDGMINWENSTWTNPLRELARDYDYKNNNLIGNAIISFEILPGLKVMSSFGVNNTQVSEVNSALTSYFNPASGSTSSALFSTFSNGNVHSWVVEPQVNWNKRIGRGSLEVLIGSTFQQLLREQITMGAQGFPSDALVRNIQAASSIVIFNDSNTDYKYNGIFSRINYNWQGKYILNVTGRRDGSSRFGPGKQFANFGAVGAAWIFSNEALLRNNPSFLSFGKLRASYGTSGNDQITDYGFLDTYSTGDQYQGEVGLKPTALFNPDFGWESNRKFEVGIELGAIADRILLSLSYYNNRSSNQLVSYTLPKTTGFSGVLTNLDAIVQNTGFEFELNVVGLQKSFFKWVTNFNLTIPKNELLDFPDLAGSSYENQFAIGKPVSIIKQYHYVGVDPVLGIYQFDDMNNDGEISTADKLSIVRLQQDFYGGLGNKITFKNLDLDFFFQFVKQIGRLSYDIRPGSMFNIQTGILDRWQGEGDDARFQRYTTGADPLARTSFSRYSQSNANYGDASFVRLKNVSLSYRFPNEWIDGLYCRLYLQGQNLLTMTRYKGIDPESTGNRLPPLRTFTAGVQLIF